MTLRVSEIKRETNETVVDLSVHLDGEGVSKIDTGVSFFDHMLDLFAKHSLIDLTITAKGDTEVDDHHTVEDVGICMGKAVDKALGDKHGINRFGHSATPMDEALADVAVDISGRGFLVFNADFPADRIGSYDVQLTEEFLRAFCTNAGITLHVTVPYGTNAHHITEAIFKGLARALYHAVVITSRKIGIPSTKGVI